MRAEDKLEKIAELINDGWSFRAIQTHMHVSYRTLNYYFPGAGWPPGWGARLGHLTRKLRRM